MGRKEHFSSQGYPPVPKDVSKPKRAAEEMLQQIGQKEKEQWGQAVHSLSASPPDASRTTAAQDMTAMIGDPQQNPNRIMAGDLVVPIKGAGNRNQRFVVHTLHLGDNGVLMAGLNPESEPHGFWSTTTVPARELQRLGPSKGQRVTNARQAMGRQMRRAVGKQPNDVISGGQLPPPPPETFNIVP